MKDLQLYMCPEFGNRHINIRDDLHLQGQKQAEGCQSLEECQCFRVRTCSCQDAEAKRYCAGQVRAETLPKNRQYNWKYYCCLSGEKLTRANVVIPDFGSLLITKSRDKLPQFTYQIIEKGISGIVKGFITTSPSILLEKRTFALFRKVLPTGLCTVLWLLVGTPYTHRVGIQREINIYTHIAYYKYINIFLYIYTHKWTYSSNYFFPFSFLLISAC